MFKILAIVISVLLLLNLAHQYDDGWSATQWGPVAAWIGSFLTFAAVSVSLWQSARAREEARQNRDDAERRHTEQIAVADRQRQIDTLSPIWIAIGDSLTPTNQLLNDLQRLVFTTSRLNKYLNPSEMHTLALTEKNDAASRVLTSLPAFSSTMYATELSFNNAMMLVTQPQALKAVEDVYQKFVDVRNSFTEATRSGLAGQPFSLVKIEEARSALSKSRDPMVKAVREHLTGGRPLRKFNT